MSFDFQKLFVYQKTRIFCSEVINLLLRKGFNPTINDQFRRASLSIMLNIAEGTARFGPKDRRRFYIIARGSAFECVAITEFLKDNKLISMTEFSSINQQLEEISKMLFSMIKKSE